MSWVDDKQSEIATIVETRTIKKIKSKYPNIEFTRDEEGDTKVHFPTVYLHFLSGSELGQTIDGQEINAMNFSVKIDVTCSKDQGLERCRDVIWEVIDQFKKLYFTLNVGPEDLTTGNENKRMVATMQRIVGNADKIG